MKVKDKLIKEAFSETLEKLLLCEKLEDVTVAEIIEASGLSRSTFYRNFRDKYELANWKYNIIFDELIKDYVSYEDAVENTKTTIRYIEKHKPFFKKILEYKGQNCFSEYYIQNCIKWMQDIQESVGSQLNPKEYYIIRYHAAGFLNVINEWLLSEQVFTADEISEIILENRKEYLKLACKVSNEE